MRRVPLYALLILLVGLGACGSPTSPTTPDPSKLEPGISALGGRAYHYLLGMWELVFDFEAGTADAIPLRFSEGHFNVRRFMENAPCDKCLRLMNFSPQPDETFYIDVEFQHPFPGLDNYTGFDVRGIAIFNATYAFPSSGLTIADRSLGGMELLNADGYTTLFNPVDFPEGSNLPVLTYTRGKIATPLSSPATLNGYRAFFPTAPRRVFPAGAVDRRNYHIARPAGTKIRVGYAVDASWEPPLTKPVEDPIVDFGPNANCPEAYRLSATIGSGLMPGCGFAPYQVDAYDHQGADTVAAATFEAPDLFDGIITDLQGTDMGTFTRFEGTLPNSLEAVEGEYRVLVGVVDTETDPFLGDMTAYTMTVATVEPAPIDYEHGWRKQGKTLDNHNHNIYETEILPDLHEVWTYQFSAAAYSLFESTPTIGESAVYYVADVPYAQEIWALPLHGGDALWHRLIKFAPDMFNYRSTPTVGNCEVYVGGSSLFCLDSEDGDVIWIETAENEPFCNGSPVVVDDILVAWSTRNALYGFNAYSGSPMWVYSNGAETGNPATPVVDNGVVYAGDIKGNAFALSLEDGHELWKVQFDIGGPITSNAIYAPPVLAGGLIWFGSWNCRLYGLDPLTGGVVRDVDLGEQLPCESAAFDGTRLYQPLAYFPPYATFFTPPYRLLAITPDGTVEWEFPGEDDEAFFSTPVVANGVVWVVSDAGMIYMLDPATGDQVGSGPYALDHSVHGGMSIQDGRLYVTDDGGKMYCLE